MSEDIVQNQAEESAQKSPSSPDFQGMGDLWQQRAKLLEEKLAPLEDLLQAEKDKALRAMAELENFKRRKEQEVEQFKRYALERVVGDLLPVLDSFDRACDHLSEEASCQAESVNGFLLIQKQFHQALEKWGVQPVDALNQAFDPTLHQAVIEEDVQDVSSGTVTKEMQKGYKLHDRVIRPAMVAVAK